MKKFLALVLALVMVLGLAACGDNNPTTEPSSAPTTAPTTEPTTAPTTEPTEGSEGSEGTEPSVTVMTYDEYMAAELESSVVVEFYVQAAQSWWDNKITLYGQDADGGYFAYEMTCTEEEAAKLVPGTKIRVTGYKTEWAGEVEIASGATFEIIEAEPWFAEPVDVTALLGTDELIAHQNELVSFTGLTVEGIEYKNGEPGYGNDIYVTVSYNGASYDFCVEAYLTDPDSAVYQAVGALNVGDVINVEGFLYWYNGVNTHITSVTHIMTHEEYMAAELESPVVVEFYVQAAQSWWDNKITLYGQDADGGYFAYEMTCTEEEAAKLVPGTKIRVTGYKTEWAGEVEIASGATFEIIEAEPWFAEPVDVTALLGTDELIAHQNELVSFTGLTVEGIEYKNGEPGYGNDIYVTVSYNGASYDFCVEAYLTDPDSAVYQAVGALNVGDVINVEGFLYWYNGVNTHITSVTPAA